MSLRKQIAEIIEQNLGEIVDATMQAYVREIPAVATAPAGALRAIRASTMRATSAFVSMYADPASPADPFVKRARAVTIERAGEILEHDDILELIRVGRATIFRTARDIVARELVVPPDTRTELEQALDAFLTELERSESLVPTVGPDALNQWLSAAEIEEPDIR